MEGNNSDRGLLYAYQLSTCCKLGSEISSELQTSARHKVYNSLIWKEVGDSCLIGIKALNGRHENMTLFIWNHIGISLVDKKNVTLSGKTGII